MSEIILITSYYLTNNIDRQIEIETCLINNLNNNMLKKIYLLNDKHYDLNFSDNENKIIQIIVDDDNKKRLSFDYVINFINSNLKDEICILSNSDIYFDDTLILLKNYNFNNKFFGLTRYDNNKLIYKADSQDSWFFKSPLNIDLSKCNFKFGHPGCDNRLAFIVKESEYEVINPCYSIKTHHLHKSKFRTYNEKNRVVRPYYFIKFSKL